MTDAEFIQALYDRRAQFKNDARNQPLLNYRILHTDYLNDEEELWDAHGKPGKRPPNIPTS